MVAEVVAVLEVELVLAALLGRAGGDQPAGARVAQDRRAELLVDEDAGGSSFGTPLAQRRLQPVIDDLLAGGDGRGLLGVSGAVKPNSPFSKDARWSNGRMYSGLSYHVAISGSPSWIAPLPALA